MDGLVNLKNISNCHEKFYCEAVEDLKHLALRESLVVRL